MVVYEKDGQRMEVEDRETAKMRVLERSGWKRVKTEVTEPPATETTEQSAVKEAEPLSMVEPEPQEDPVSLVEVDPYGTDVDEPAHHSTPQKLAKTDDEEDDKKVAKRARPAK